MAQEPRWVGQRALCALVDVSIAIDGGLAGLRDEGLLQSALGRPVNRFHYEGVTEVPSLAATYLLAITGNHPFLDGNKRAGFIAMGLFLELNGFVFTAPEADAALTVFAIAAGERTLEQVEEWVRQNSSPK